VQPLDVPAAADIPVPALPDGQIPINDTTRLRVENGNAVLTTEVGGVPIDLRIDPQGIRASADRFAQEAARLRDGNQDAIRRAQEEQQRAARAAQAAGQRLTEQLREAGRQAERQLQQQSPP
jgi:penicillin-binding protein 1A